MISSQKSEWNGYVRLDFPFQEHSAILVLPNKPRDDGKWLLKTEYFGAFPAFELEMLKRGYHLAHIQNTTRWCIPEDTDRQAAFCKYLYTEFNLAPKCILVGMSCGGMQAMYLAGKHPELVEALYLDAPVLNLLSCPCNVGRGERGAMYEEMVRATGKTISTLINDRSQPIDFANSLIRNRIPLALICGDSDTVVPYCENGEILANKYRASGIPFFEVVKANCSHHPHGLEDLVPLLRFFGERESYDEA